MYHIINLPRYLHVLIIMRIYQQIRTDSTNQRRRMYLSGKHNLKKSFINEKTLEIMASKIVEENIFSLHILHDIISFIVLFYYNEILN